MRKPSFVDVGAVMMIVTPILGLVVGIWALNQLSGDVSSMTKPYKDAVGTKIVLAGDTLTVVDYSIVHSTVILSNTQSVSFEFYKKLKK